MFEDQDDISDDDTDESSLPQNKSSVEDALASFREKWQQELRVTSKKRQLSYGTSPEASAEDIDVDTDEDAEEKAKSWFLKGAELERSGIFYEAIQCYKKAVQLVPDIELKVCPKPPPKAADHVDESFNHEGSDNDIDDEDSEDEDIKEGMLLQRIQHKMAKNDLFCTPKYEQRVMHISSLPTEILLYIFKWIVSADLDLRSLEICSMVCRGFYVVARDSEIWRLACLKIWGSNCGPTTSSYPTWRQMYINRPRLRYNGCYISKTTYIRHGENSFQDQFYRPWHLVCYYRYLRFFPDGIVLMLTTADEPQMCVGQLKNRNAKLVQRGHYRLKDDRVILVVQDQQRVNVHNKYKKNKNKWQHESGEQTFHLEFQILDNNKRKHIELVWKYYTIFIKNRNGTESKSSFEIANSRFPPLWFSRVKSYTSETTTPLI